MTLRRKMACEIAAMILGLLLVSAASLWGLNGLHQDFDSAIAGYEQLRQVYEITAHVATARRLLGLSRPEEEHALAELDLALARAGLYSAEHRAWNGSDHAGHDAGSSSGTRLAQLRDAVLQALRQGFEEVRSALQSNPPRTPDAVVTPLNRVLTQVADLASEIRRQIQERQSAGDRKRRTTMLLMSILCALVVLGAAATGVWQYRSVMAPLGRLSRGVRTIASGRLSERIAPEGPAEFSALAEEFNRMARELDELYRSLEEKAASKSRQLVRSERLASVGYLAAGVAHEINNPIGIIAAHAELLLQQLQASSAADTDMDRGLRVICEEAFRCKQIVQRLLSLSRPGEEQRQPVALDQIAAAVVEMVKALGTHRHKRLELRATGQDLRVLASQVEMKQVVLNLTINALEAVEEHAGLVRIDVSREGPWVELAVSDNGRGMSPEVLERVFEPFFTDKRGAAAPGSGLGLSIAHAIIQAHGGSLSAYSDGPGRGSRFVVRLPALDAPGALQSRPSLKDPA